MSLNVQGALTYKELLSIKAGCLVSPCVERARKLTAQGALNGRRTFVCEEPYSIRDTYIQGTIR
jgi:hypothetical protein